MPSGTESSAGLRPSPGTSTEEDVLLGSGFGRDVVPRGFGTARCRVALAESLRPAAVQVAPLDKLSVVHYPERTEIVLITDEAFMQRKVRTNGVLRTCRHAKRRQRLVRRFEQRLNTLIYVNETTPSYLTPLTPPCPSLFPTPPPLA